MCVVREKIWRKLINSMNEVKRLNLVSVSMNPREHEKFIVLGFFPGILKKSGVASSVKYILFPFSIYRNKAIRIDFPKL